jgi:hypothetical protein
VNEEAWDSDDESDRENDAGCCVSAIAVAAAIYPSPWVSRVRVTERAAGAKEESSSKCREGEMRDAVRPFVVLYSGAVRARSRGEEGWCVDASHHVLP